MADVRSRRGGGRAGRQQQRAAAVVASQPFLTRALTAGRARLRGGSRAARAQCRDHPARGRHRGPRLPERGRPLRRCRRRRRRRSGALPAGAVPPTRRRRRRRPTPSTPAIPPAPSRSGAMATVFAPNYGSPFVHDLDAGRRYATLADFENFVRLAYLAPAPAPLRRDGVRARRRAGQQAAPRHGVRPPAPQ